MSKWFCPLSNIPLPPKQHIPFPYRTISRWMEYQPKSIEKCALLFTLYLKVWRYFLWKFVRLWATRSFILLLFYISFYIKGDIIFHKPCFTEQLFYRTSPVAAAPESFRFRACNFIIKRLRQKRFSVNFAKF